ncbi:hypothetical protein [Pseudoduganella armeniaca]|uniref:Uncharacterized protein n=1 Tax=Pseudoduganella armeniaca TaxID=2072590 RepID=A0A2R4C424_9BURK|nr:hypothetical protein [Pseudoduganella armeniaca]AVR94334.1 hypothetical protein C9I28_00380 [Pseudoduganella armeniaca]
MIAFSLSLDRGIEALLPAARPAPARQQARRADLATPAPPAAPVRPGQPQAPVIVARPQRRPADKPAPGRDAPPSRELEDAAERRGEGLAIVACREREQGSGDNEDGDGTPAASEANADMGTQDELEGALLAALLAQGPDSGMFEVLLPGGETLGVAVDARPEAIDYLLTPASERLGAQLRGRQMELAGQLRQRIGRSVRVTVL